MERSRHAYTKGEKIALALPKTNPIRLSLALNFCVFFFEIVEDSETACFRARSVYDAAVAEMNSLSVEAYYESFAILELIKENLAHWKEGTNNP